MIRSLLKIGAALILLNEVRGIIMAAPVFVGLIHSGGELMALWLAFCSLAGIALSVAVPWWLLKKAGRRISAQTPALSRR